MNEKRELPILNGKLLSDLDANGHKIIGVDIEFSPEKIKEAIAPELEELGEAIAKKVDAVEGKGLSTEDYTTADKEKLGGIEAGAQKNVTPVTPAYENAGKPADAAELYRIISSLTDLINEVYNNVGKIEYGYIPNLLPRYPFEDAEIVDGVVTVAPYTNAKLVVSDGTAFSVAVGGEGGFMRDCVLMVVCSNDTAPTITWPSNFHPRTDAETDFACVACVRNVYWISEHSEGEFVVAGWQETEGGNAK